MILGNLQAINASGSPEAQMNNNFSAVGSASVFGPRVDAMQTGLDYAYYGGPWNGSLISQGTVTLTPSSTNYIEINAAGTVSSNTTGFTAGRMQIAKINTTAAAIDLASFEDWRLFIRNAAENPLFLIGARINGLPDAGDEIIAPMVPFNITYAVDLAGSTGKASVAATAQTDFDIQQNNTSIGTMRFAAGATTASFIMATQTTLSIGDVLSVIAPGTQDATLADIDFILKGERG